MAEKRTEVVQPEGNYYDKYHSVNPIVKWMMKGFKDAIRELLDLVEKEFYQVCETGCGEGEITSFIKELYPEAEIDAFDISEKVIAEAGERLKDINFYVGNIYTMEVNKAGEDEKHILNKEKYDLVVCSEVLEHLEDPEQALRNIKGLCTENGFILLSVPKEPIWRICNMARGKYWKDFGNTPGHIQHWSKKKFCRMVAVSCIIKIPIIAEGSPQSCRGNFPIIAEFCLVFS